MVLCLIFSLLPVSAFADEATASGTCGDDLTWTLQDGALTISGTGDMEDYDWLYAPWYDDNDKIESVEIKNGVTSIGYYAFSNCRNLKKLTVSESVTSIRQSAFEYCSSLESVTIPASVTSIERNAFDECWSLDKVYYSGTMEQWGAIDVGVNNYYLLEADIYCKDGNITQPIYCGEDLTWAFKDGTLTISGTGDMFDYHGTDAPWFGKSKRIENVVLQGGVTSIGYYAFANCTNLKKATIPDGVTSIGEGAFTNCPSLESVTIPASVTSIGVWAFDSWSLDEVRYLGTMEQWNAITIRAYNDRLLYAGIQCTDGDINGPYSCGENVTWLYEDGTLTISGTGDMFDYDSFYDVPWYDKSDEIKSVVFTEGVTSIGYCAFRYCTSIKSLTIPASVKSIGDYAFDAYAAYGYSALSEVNYSGTMEQWRAIDIGRHNATLKHADVICSDGTIIAPNYCGEDTTWTLENGVLTISGTGDMYGYYAVDGGAIPWYFKRKLIEKIVIDEGVTSIGDAVFNGCTNLKSITIPESVTYIGRSAFVYCDALKDINYAGTVAQWNEIYVNDYNITLIPATIHCEDGDIRTSSYCGSNVRWTLEDGVLTVSGSGNMYNYQEDSFTPWYDQAESITSVVIDDGVTGIGAFAFYNCKNVKNIPIPDSVTVIQRWAFSLCSSLESITIPGSVTEINDYAFHGCTKLKDVVISEGVERIAPYAFSDCDSLESVTLPSTIESLGKSYYLGEYAGVFADCQKLKNIIVSEDNEAFSSDDGVLFSKDKSEIITYPAGKEAAEYQIPNSVVSISYNAFMGCKNLQTVDIPDSVVEIKDKAFFACEGLKNIVLPSSVTTIGNEAFFGCLSLESITIPYTVTYIGNNALGACDALEDVYYVGFVSGWNELYPYDDLNNAVVHFANPMDIQASGDCGRYVTWTLDKGVLTISGEGDMPYYDCYDRAPWYYISEAISKVVIEDGVTSIGSCAFANFANLTEITIPDSVKRIEADAFKNCKNLKSVAIPEDVYYIGYEAFYGCESLTEIKLPDGVTRIWDSAFAGCTNLVKFEVNESNPNYCTIDGVLYSKDKTTVVRFPAGKEAESYTVPNTVTNISYNAFSGCAGLKGISIPDSVVSIGSSAFADCINLTSANIPSGITTIEESVFSGCAKLESINIPEGVTTIRAGAFDGCDSFESVKLPNSASNVSGFSFSGINLKAFIVNDNNPYYFAQDGVLFERIPAQNSLSDEYEEQFALVRYPTGKTDESYTVPAFVRSINAGAFAGNTYIKSIVIHDGITDIKYATFENCTSLESIVIPESVTYFDWAFSGCDSLKHLYYKGSEDQWYQIEKIWVEPENVTVHYNYTGVHIHSYTAVVTEPTCTEEGYTTYTCECGDNYIDSYVDALGHDRIHHDGKAPTCTKSGFEAYDTCTGCDYTTYKEIAKTAHQYVETVFAPTCTVKGYTTHTCSVCGDNYIDSYVDALGHNRIHHDGKAPTCTESGFEAYDTCSRCDYTTYKELAALGHDFGEWTVTTKPTCTEKGTETKSCSRCDATETREVAALGHDYEHGTCTRCGEKDPNYIAAPVLKITTSAGKPKVSWSKVDGAAKYKVFYSTDGKKYYQLIETTKTSVTHTKAKIGTTYYYVVKAVNANGDESEFSNDVSIKCVPAAPTVTISRSGGKAKLSWKAVSDATKYYVYRSTDGVKYKPYYTVSKTSFTDSKSASGTKYYYKVMAVAVVNETNVGSAFSAVKSIMTTLAKPTVKITTSNGKPKLSWSKVTGADKYYVYRSTNGKDYTILIKTTKTSVTNTGAKKGVKYYYKVKAVCSANTNANSAFSAVVSIKATK